MWFKVHRNVNDIRAQIIVFIKKHIIILFTHKSIHNRKGIKYRMSFPRWATSLVVSKQFWSDQSAFDQNDTMRLYGVRKGHLLPKGKNDMYTQIESNTCSVNRYIQFSIGGFMSHLCYLCLFAHSGVQHILYCVFVFYSSCCHCLWIVHFGIL
jgi:hypothetical protein